MESIKKIIKELFQVMGFNDIETDIKKDNSLKERELLLINVKTNPQQADYFIKEGAIGLTALQRLVRILASKEVPDQTFFVLDINNYRKRREQFLVDLALKTAEEVRKTKKPVTLEPMPAYERRFIHLRLAEQPDIVTESIGYEPERKVVVRLYP